jgi:hypothetical protein
MGSEDGQGRILDIASISEGCAESFSRASCRRIDVALGGLIWFRGGKPAKNWFSALALATAVLVTVLMAWTAYLSGQICHSEIRPDTVAMSASQRAHP